MVNRLLVVDGHAEFKAGLRKLFDNSPQFSIIGEADSADDAIRLAGNLRPELVLIDVRLGQASGLDAIPKILAVSPATRVLVVSLREDRRYVAKSVAAGASGYVLKDEAGDRLLEAAGKVCEGQRYFSPEDAGDSSATG